MITTRTRIIVFLIALVAAGCAGATAVSDSSAIETDSSEQAPSSPASAVPSPWVLRNPTVDPSATTLDILVSERECASGLRADDRISYELTSDETEVVITALITPVVGGAECPGNPFTPLSVALDEPIGDRELIDGSGMVVDQYDDYTAPPGPIPHFTTETPLPAITPATTLTAESMFYIEARCEVPEDDFEDRVLTGWNPGGVFAEPEHVIASAVAGFGLSEEGWHLVESSNAFGQVTYSWTQYLDGIPKASLLVLPALRGWEPGGTVVCDLGGPWTPDAEPPADREVVPLTAPASDLADVESALEQIDSLSAGEADWTFANGQQRCAAWIELEMALELTGHVLQSRYVLETDGQEDTWQVRMSVLNAEGELALLSTTGTNGLVVEQSPLPQLSDTRGHRQSGLGPCWLDASVSGGS